MVDMDQPLTAATPPPAKKSKRSKSNAKGNEAEILAKTLLESHGYLVHRAARAFRPVGGGVLINAQTDIFGAFDLVCVKAGERVRFVQVTTGSRIGEKQKQMQHVPYSTFYTQEVWEWMKRPMEKGMTREDYRKWLFFRVRIKNGAGSMGDPVAEIHPMKEMKK
jgi:hypothetical protein